MMLSAQEIADRFNELPKRNIPRRFLNDLPKDKVYILLKIDKQIISDSADVVLCPIEDEDDIFVTKIYKEQLESVFTPEVCETINNNTYRFRI